MNGKTQPMYAPEFRQQIVDLYASGRGAGELVKEFGCPETSVHAWVKKAGACPRRLNIDHPRRLNIDRGSLVATEERNCR